MKYRRGRILLVGEVQDYRVVWATWRKGDGDLRLDEPCGIEMDEDGTWILRPLDTQNDSGPWEYSFSGMSDGDEAVDDGCGTGEGCLYDAVEVEDQV